MRIATHKIYRAFPELDRFNDDRCQDFVRSANRGVIRSFVRWAVLFAFVSVVSIGVGYLFFLAYTAVGFDPEVHRTAWVSFVGMAAPIVVGFTLAVLGALVLRDMLLRRRIRSVITLRGTCSECDYVLLGLTVGPDLKVTCPECGSVTIADESMNELANGTGGQRVFSPPDAEAAAMYKPRKRWISKHTRRLILRGTLAATALFVLSVLGLWLVVYLQTRSDIRAAVADRVTREDVMALIQRDWPPMWRDGQVDATAELQSLLAEMHEIERSSVQVVREREGASQDNVYVDYSVFVQSDPLRYYQTESALRIGREVADLAADRTRESGLEQRIHDVMVRAWADPNFVGFDDPKAHRDWGVRAYGPLRHFARYLMYQAQRAKDTGDLEHFVACVRTGLSLVRFAAERGDLLGALISGSMEHMVMNQIRQALIFNPHPDWVDAIDAIWVNHNPRSDPAVVTDQIRLFSLDQVAHWFANQPANPMVSVWRDLWDDDEFRMPFSDPSHDYWHETGRYRANRREVDEFYKPGRDAAMLEPYQRSANWMVYPAVSLPIAADALMGYSQYLQENDALVAERRGLSLMIEIERYRASEGHYPRELREVLNGATTVDPYTGAPFGYRLIDPTADQHGRGYLLWSTGDDAIDHGAVKSLRPGLRWAATRGGRSRVDTEIDLVINDPSN